MILTCPACGTQYRLKDGAIPPEGRQVRCAACKHKWHEDGASGDDAAADVVAPASAPPAAPDQPSGEWPVRGIASDFGDIGGGPPPPEPDAAVQPSATIPQAAVHDAMVAANPEPEVGGNTTGDVEAVVPATDDEPAHAGGWSAPVEPYPAEDPFTAIPAMHEEEEERRAGKLGWIVGLVLLVVAAAAAFYFFAPPELKARAGIAEVGESPLQLMLTTSDRQRLASGNELLAISGRVINATDRVQAVPPIQAELRDPASNRLVYQWTIAPPARSLAPGAAASFNSAEVDVPQGGESLSLRFAS